MDQLNQTVVTEIKSLITVSSAKGRMEKMTDRICYGLSFCAQGQITYTHKGKRYVSDPNHAVLLPKGQSYTIHGDKKGIFPVINFECLDFLSDTIIVLPIGNTGSYLKEYEQMKSLALFEKNRTKVMSIFYNMLHRLSNEGNIELKTLLPAIRYLEENYSSPQLTNTELATQCGISEVYFRKLFQKAYGVTPKQFIIDTRINKAKQLLTDSILKVNAVSEACGFTNPYHFCRLFKQKVGLTPTEYMKQNKTYKI